MVNIKTPINKNIPKIKYREMGTDVLSMYSSITYTDTGSLKNIQLPITVAKLYNYATLECILNLYKEGLRLTLENGKVTNEYLIPDNSCERRA